MKAGFLGLVRTRGGRRKRSQRTKADKGKCMVIRATLYRGVHLSTFALPFRPHSTLLVPAAIFGVFSTRQKVFALHQNKKGNGN
jgi:hypothetical protein